MELSSPRLTPEIDALVDEFYHEIVGPYWDKERNWVDQLYKTVPLPFQDIDSDFQFEIEKPFSLATFSGYLNTWSAVKHYINQNGNNPTDELTERMAVYWKQTEYVARYPGFIRLGRPKKS